MDDNTFAFWVGTAVVIVIFCVVQYYKWKERNGKNKNK